MKTVEGYDVDRKAISVLADGEVAVFAARPSFATAVAGIHWDATTLLLTERRLIIVKDRIFGKGRADCSIEWEDVRSVEGSLWNGGGPQIQLLVYSARSDEPIELIVRPQEAVEIESAIRAGYLR